MPKVLLVEDDNNLREIFEMRLQAEGYQTVTASDGEEALVVATKEKPDLIIADVMMPKLSGFEMLETLRAAPEMSNVKVIMMTALGQAEDRARGEKLGVVKYLVKSQVTLEDFVRVVREVLSPDANGATQTSTNAADGQQDKSSNNQSEEGSMDDNQGQSNMPPASDPAAGGNPMSGDDAATPAPADDQMTTAQEQNVVNNQVNDFAANAPGGPAPADDSGAGGQSGGMPGDDGGMPPTSPPMPNEPGTPPQDAPKPDEGQETTPPAGGM